MLVHVLLDNSTPPIVYAVVTDPAVVDAWHKLGEDADLSVGSVEMEIDDFSVLNILLEELDVEL